MEQAMTRFLVDTDILVDASRGVPEAGAFLEQLEGQGTLAVSVITKMELLVGCRNKPEQRVVQKFLERFEVFPINEMASQLAERLIARYRLTHGIQIPDALIAATASTSGYSLATKNQKHFRYVPGLKLLPYP